MRIAHCTFTTDRPTLDRYTVTDGDRTLGTAVLIDGVFTVATADGGELFRRDFATYDHSGGKREELNLPFHRSRDRFEHPEVRTAYLTLASRLLRRASATLAQH